MTSSTSDYNYPRIYSADELRVVCPMLRIMHSLELIGLCRVRASGYLDWGSEGYIINVYDRFRSKKDNMGNTGTPFLP